MPRLPITISPVHGVTLSEFGKSIVRKGGHDDQDDDGMLILELAQRLPGLSVGDLQKVFVAMRVQYGEEALQALREGYVVIEEARAGTRPEEEVGNG